ncbi:MAG: hypothetical protein ABMA64_12525 [Myxococcota bacterium]
MGWLYRYETMAIQAWILSTGRMKDLVGGSNVIEALGAFARERATACGGLVHYAAAGGATIEFPDTSGLERFARWWPVAVDEQAPGLPIVQSWVEQGSDDVSRLYAALATSRNRSRVALPEAGPWLRRPPRTGLPATEWRDGTSVDRMTAAQQDAARDGRDELRATLARPQGCGLVDPNRLGQCARLAVIHADGNGIGRRIRQLNLQEVAEFSNTLARATKMAARRATMVVEDDDRVAWLRPVVLGGDDLTVLVRAADALPFVRAYLNAFEEETGALTACVGVAIVPSSWPFAEAHTLAEQLCGAAKTGMRRDDGTPSGVAFHRVKTALTGDWSQVVEDELTVDGGVLTDGPYGLERLPKLLDLVRVLRKLPRGTVRQWLALQHASGARADRHWQRAQEVAHNDDWTDLQNALAALGAGPDGWRHAGGKRRTPIGDALSLASGAP